MRPLYKNTLALALSAIAVFSFGQEVDDLYFTKKDRTKVKPVNEVASSNYYSETSNVNEGSSEGVSFLRKQNQLNPISDSETYVSEESIARYRKDASSQGNYSNNVNPNYSNPNDTYYEDDYYYQDGYSDRDVIVNNYYNYPSRNRFRNGWNVGFNTGWSNWGWGSGISVSYGWSSYDPWFDPFYANNWGWNTGWGWNAGWGWNNRGWNNWGWGGGWNSWGRPYYGNSYTAGFYDGYYGRRTVATNNRSVERGARTSRGEAVSSSGRTSSRNGASRASEMRDYSQAQSRYLNRSRSSNSNVSSGRSSSNSSGSTRSYTPSSRSSSTGSVRSNSSTRSSSGSSVRPSSNSSRSSSGSVRSSGSSSRSSSGSVRSSSGSSRSSSGSVRSSGSSSSRSSGSSSSSRSSSSSSSRSKRGN